MRADCQNVARHSARPRRAQSATNRRGWYSPCRCERARAGQAVPAVATPARTPSAPATPTAAGASHCSAGARAAAPGPRRGSSSCGSCATPARPPGAARATGAPARSSTPAAPRPRPSAAAAAGAARSAACLPQSGVRRYAHTPCACRERLRRRYARLPAREGAWRQRANTCGVFRLDQPPRHHVPPLSFSLPVRGATLPPRVRSQCRFALLLTHFIPESLGQSVPLFLKRQCDRARRPPPPVAVGARREVGLPQRRPRRVVARLGFGRVVVSEKEAPILLVNMV